MMKDNIKIEFLIILILVMMFGSCTSSIQQGQQEKPNVILIVTDDLGFSDLGSYGGEINTPNLDKLAYEGMRFTQFYNGAVCFVSRAAMLTGAFTRPEGPGFIKENMVTMGEVMSSNGYSTILSGKWHLGEGKYSPNKKGFQEYYGSIAGAINYFDPSLPTDPPFLQHHHSAEEPFMHNDKVIESVSHDYYSTDAITDHAIDQIHKNVNQNKPFFLHLAYNAPHYPLHALPEDIEKYKGKYDDGYIELRKKRYEKLVELGIISPEWGLPDPDESKGEVSYDMAVPPWDLLEDKEYEAKKMEVYSAMIDRVDQNIGRLMASLDKAGITENTIILFLSDNGGCAGLPRKDNMETYYAYNEGKTIGSKSSYEFCGPGWATVQSSPFRRYKAWTYEGGISTPMIAYWKSTIKPGIITEDVGHVVDLFPTIMDITGGVYPTEFNGRDIIPLEGQSLLPTLMSDGENVVEDKELGWFLYGNRAYRKGDWKIVWGVSDKKWELFNMKDDRTEGKDLSMEFPQMVEQLSSLWLKWAEKCGFSQEEINK